MTARAHAAEVGLRFFQSKDRYVSLDEIRGIAQRYRRAYPLDAIVQDWFWWKTRATQSSIPTITT